MAKNEKLVIEETEGTEHTELLTAWSQPEFTDESACAELCAYVFTA